MALLASKDTLNTVETPDWVLQVVAACAILCESASCRFSSVAVSGPIPRGSHGKRLLRLMVEELAEKYDLEVILEIRDTSFVANFGLADPVSSADR